jgi:hypothetical protein
VCHLSGWHQLLLLAGFGLPGALPLVSICWRRLLCLHMCRRLCRHLKTRLLLPSLHIRRQLLRHHAYMLAAALLLCTHTLAAAAAAVAV